MRNYKVRAVLPAALVLFSALGAAAAEPPIHVPFVVGLTTVRTVSAPAGDFESVQVVADIGRNAATLVRSAEVPDDSGEVRELTIRRIVSNEDRQNSRTLRMYFHTSDPEEFPGTSPTATAVMVNELRAAGKTSLVYLDVEPLFGMTVIQRTLRGSLTRVGTKPVDVTVLVNGRLSALPAWHATGHLSESGDGEDFEFFILDEPENPLILRWKGAGVASAVTKIEFPEPQPGSTLERTLLERKHALVYGIYFEFNRADIRKVSEPTLKEIAGVMQKHPDWKLNVAGHTDSIGGDPANLDLSRRRAQSVKAALVSRYHIAPDRLTTSGYGASQPQDRNDTPEGRARNRRVELTRQ